MWSNLCPICVLSPLFYEHSVSTQPIDLCQFLLKRCQTKLWLHSAETRARAHWKTTTSFTGHFRYEYCCPMLMSSKQSLLYAICLNFNYWKLLSCGWFCFNLCQIAPHFKETKQKDIFCTPRLYISVWCILSLSLLKQCSSQPVDRGSIYLKHCQTALD